MKRFYFVDFFRCIFIPLLTYIYTIEMRVGSEFTRWNCALAGVVVGAAGVLGSFGVRQGALALDFMVVQKFHYM